MYFLIRDGVTGMRISGRFDDLPAALTEHRRMEAFTRRFASFRKIENIGLWPDCYVIDMSKRPKTARLFAAIFSADEVSA